MELSYLKEFIVLSETGNYLEAADQLYISQSSLSRHIKALEDELGVTLFERTTRKVILNTPGSMLLPYARQIVGLHQKYQDDLYTYKKNIQGTLSIGSIPSMQQYNILDLVIRYEQKYPNYSLNMIEDDPIRLTTMVQNGELDMAFIRTTSPVKAPLTAIEYTRDYLTAVVPAGHKLASHSTISLSDLKNENLLLLSTDTYMYQLCVNACHQAGFEPIIKHTSRRGENLLALVQKNMGIALLTHKPIQESQRADIISINIAPEISTSISLIYRKDHSLSIPAREFLSMASSQEIIT
nr:LysR family transcriptional regulator [uncultured Blautia sp.]